MPVQQPPLRTSPLESTPGGLRKLRSNLEPLRWGRTSKLQPPRRPHQQLLQSPSVHHLQILVGCLSSRKDAQHLTNLQLFEVKYSFNFISLVWLGALCGWRFSQLSAVV